MANRRTRRSFLRSGTLCALLGGAGCASPPDAASDERRIATLETENAALEDRLASLSRRAAALEERGPGTEFPAEVRERARVVGERVRPAVIALQSREPLSSGTAWFLDGGHIVTNGHVLDLIGTPFTCRTIDGEAFEAEVVGRTEADGPGPDLAVLSADVTPPATLPAGDSTSLTRGQPVVQVGHTHVGYWAITLGEVVRRVELPRQAWVLTEIPTMRGNSGSPLVTLDGAAVGVTFGTVPRGDAPPSRVPTPGPPTVYEEYPRQARMYGGHVAIETVTGYLERWLE